MNALNQIATHLEIEASKISRCEEWVKVWFVVIHGKGARFVSKKVVAEMSEDKIISEEVLENGMKRQKSVLDGRQVTLYSNFHTGGDFALRIQHDGRGFAIKVDVYLDGEHDATWRRGRMSSGTWTREYDSKRAKSIDGIINRYKQESAI